jgi:hypothetical protein
MSERGTAGGRVGGTGGGRVGGTAGGTPGGPAEQYNAPPCDGLA